MQREKIRKFLNTELNAVTEDFGKKFSAPATYLFRESEEIFVGLLVKFDEGEMIVKFKSSNAFPRKGEYLQAMYLTSRLQNLHSWNGMTYGDLLKNRVKGSEAVCVWQSKSTDGEYILLGFRGIDLSFAEFLKNAPNALIVFGPHQPPIQYLQNLLRLTYDEVSKGVQDILDYSYCNISNIPIGIKREKPVDFIYQQIQNSPVTILQGPPGTGKTQLIAELCNRLCHEGKSVLVTALTNRALIEVATKDASGSLLKEGRVYKSKLTLDEEKEAKGVNNLQQVLPIKGSVVMATYYIASGFGADLNEDGVFDVVIMDEASQALLPMFAVAKKIGCSNLWVGDTAQLGPIVSINSDKIQEKDLSKYVEGLTTMAQQRCFPIYQLTKTFRLSQRGANYTSLFYNEYLTSNKKDNIIFASSINKILHPHGGPFLLLTDMNLGDYNPSFALDMITFIAHSFVQECRNKELAILTPFRKTVRSLQKAISLRLGVNNNVLIDTIARVQGLTSDITIFVIPNTSLAYSLEEHLFNVATSRAKSHTLIVADKSILNYKYMSKKIRSYLTKLSEEASLFIPATDIPANFKIISQ